MKNTPHRHGQPCLSPIPPPQVRELPSPAGPGSAQPNLAVAADGRVYLSWIERLGEDRFALRFAVRDGDRWSAPRSIAEGSNWFVNWADFPSMLALPDGSLAAHWLVRTGDGTYAYQVNIARSFDQGETWGKPLVPHRDGTQTEHGFVSLLATPEGELAAVWLDGRETTPAAADPDHGGGEMTLRYAKMRREGTLGDEALLDTRVCDCCQTSAAMTSDGPVVAFRDRSEQELRDVSVVRLKTAVGPNPARCSRTAGRSAAAPSMVRQSPPQAAAWRSPGSPQPMA